jgi:hypothetical protein
VVQPAVKPPAVAPGQEKKQKVQPPVDNQGKDSKGGGGKNGKGKGKKK